MCRLDVVPRSFVLFLLFAVSTGWIVASRPATAQPCSYEWSDAFRAGDFDAEVRAFALFDDGSGAMLYAGGSFTRGGGGPASYIAVFDGTQWQPVDGGTDQRIESLVVFDDGSGSALYAAGAFTTAGGLPIRGIARWNGSTWSAVGGSADDGAGSGLFVYDDGTGAALYFGGSFSSIGGTAASGVAKWDGVSWSPLGMGLGGSAYTFESFDDGTGHALVAAGAFSTAGGLPAGSIAEWDGSTWTPLGSGLDSLVFDLAVFDDGGGPTLYCAGLFANAGGVPAPGLASWNGSTWSAPSVAPIEDPNFGLSLLAHDDGSGPALWFGHTYVEAAGVATGLQRFDGTTWELVGSEGPNSEVWALDTLGAGVGAPVFAGGNFTKVDSLPASRIARWNSGAWGAVGNSDLGAGLSRNANAFAVGAIGGGDSLLYVTGSFLNAGVDRVDCVASWDGSTWQPLAEGLDEIGYALSVFDEGAGPNLFAGGRFTRAGDTTAAALARWDGSSWSAIGGGIERTSANPEVQALATFDDGTGMALYAAGYFDTAGGVPASNIARWDGSTWSPLGDGVSFGVFDMAVFDDDGLGADLYVAGQISSAGGQPIRGVARWDGSGWSSVGGSLNSGSTVYSLAVHDDGSGPALFVGGFFNDAGGQPIANLAKWDGVSWSAVPGVTGVVRTLETFDDGSGAALYASGTFDVGGGAQTELARWDGSTWSDFGGGTTPQFFRATVLAALDPDGTGPESTTLFAGGPFLRVGDVSSPYLAAWQSNPRSLACALEGSVDRNAGAPVDVLFVNGSSHATNGRRTAVSPGVAFDVFLESPPANPGATPFALYVWRGAATTDTVAVLPQELGLLAQRAPFQGGTPARIANLTFTFPQAPLLGTHRFPAGQGATPAPATVLSLPGGIPAPFLGRTFTLQALVEDASVPAALPLAPTNAVIVDVE